MSYCSLDPVSTAVMTALNVAALTTLATGGVYVDVPQGAAYPHVRVELNEAQPWGGMGTRPGHGALPEIDLRVSVFSSYAGMKEAHGIMAKVIELLAGAIPKKEIIVPGRLVNFVL